MSEELTATISPSVGVRTLDVVKDCCEVQPVQDAQRRVLRIVLAINAVMFAAEFVVAVLAHSTALLADSADMLGDAIVYGFSLYVIGRGTVWQARATLLKGAIMAAFAVTVLVEIALKLTRGVTPDAGLMSGMGAVALAANAAVLVFLWRHRSDDLNMRSVWLCSRNDVVANAGVLIAGAGVALTRSPWPDVATGIAIAALFATSALDVIRSALLRVSTTASR
jgi:Co/Zn/Cd efflux system component